MKIPTILFQACAWIFALGSLSAQTTNNRTEVETAPQRSFFDPIGDFARDSILRPTQPFELIPGKNPNDWTFTLEPYAWAIAYRGNTAVKGAPASSINYSSVTVLQNLQWFIFGRGEIRKGRWGIMADGYYAALTGSAEIDNHIYESGQLGLQQSIVSMALAYRIIDDRRGYLDVYAGARYNYIGMQLRTSLNQSRIDTIANNATNAIAARIRNGLPNITLDDLNREIQRDPELRRLIRAKIIRDRLTGGAVADALSDFIKADAAANANATKEELRAAVENAKKRLTKEIAKRIKDKTPTYATGNQWWIDPIVGVRGQVNLTRWLYLAAEGDAGGFGVGSDIAWNAQASVGVNFTRNIFAEVGYRYMYFDYSDGGFLYNVNQYGIFSSVGVNF